MNLKANYYNYSSSSCANRSNYQDLLKVFATITMVVDHLGLYLFPDLKFMRLIGRIAMPIFCFFAGYNFKHQPNTKILLLGIVLYVIVTLLLRQITTPNILISIYLGQWYLYLFSKQLSKLNSSLLHVMALVLLSRVTSLWWDYGSLAIVVMVLGFIEVRKLLPIKIIAIIIVMLSAFNTLIAFNNDIFKLKLNTQFSILESVNLYIASVFILGVLQYVLMVTKNFDQTIALNVSIISRNTLMIYVTHLIIIQIISCTLIN